MTSTSTSSFAVGGFRGRVIPEGDTDWQDISGPDEIVRFYDPTDVFGDLAEAIVEAFPGGVERRRVPTTATPRTPRTKRVRG